MRSGHDSTKSTWKIKKIKKSEKKKIEKKKTCACVCVWCFILADDTGLYCVGFRSEKETKKKNARIAEPMSKMVQTVKRRRQRTRRPGESARELVFGERSSKRQWGHFHSSHEEINATLYQNGLVREEEENKSREQICFYLTAAPLFVTRTLRKHQKPEMFPANRRPI